MQTADGWHTDTSCSSNGVAVQAMLTNIVSPASLYNSEPSNPAGSMMLGLHSNASQESQHSQNSLFSSDVPNSMELFSQPNSSQSQSQTTAAPFMREHNGGNGVCVQEEGRGRSVGATLAHGQQPLSNPLNGSSQSSQMSCGKKYYMKYLTQFSVGGRRDREGGGNKTPLRAEGDTAFSRTSFDAWKIRQQEKLENKKIIDGVIQTTKDIAKELNDNLESLRAEIRDATTPMTAGRQQQEVLSDHQTRSIFAQLLQGQVEIKQQLLQGQVETRQQLLQGQVEIKQQLADLQRQCAQHREGVESLRAHISDTHCPNKLPSSVQSSLMEHIRGCISEAVQESLRNCTSKLEEMIASSRRGGVIASSCRGGVIVSPRRGGVIASSRRGGEKGCTPAVEEFYEMELLNGGGTLMPIDQAVPSMNVDLCVGGSPREGGILCGERMAGASADAPLLSHKQQVKGCSVNTEQHATQKLDPGANSPLDPDLSHLPTHLQNTRTQGDLTSQSSAAYDIDLTQQSPSVCSQIISQHLEQCCGGGTRKRKGMQEYSVATRERLGDPVPAGTPLKRRKLPAQDRGRGGRRRGGRHTVAVSQSPYIKRRSQRIRKQTPMMQRVDIGESDPTPSPSRGVGGIRRKAPLRGRPPSSFTHTPLGEVPSVSPLNALNDSLYSQNTAPTRSSATTPGVQPLPSTAAHAPLSAGKFQRSSEAARRRMRIIAGMSSSEAALKEISESLKSQMDAEPSP